VGPGTVAGGVLGAVIAGPVVDEAGNWFVLQFEEAEAE